MVRAGVVAVAGVALVGVREVVEPDLVILPLHEESLSCLPCDLIILAGVDVLHPVAFWKDPHEVLQHGALIDFISQPHRPPGELSAGLP